MTDQEILARIYDTVLTTNGKVDTLTGHVMRVDAEHKETRVHLKEMRRRVSKLEGDVEDTGSHQVADVRAALKAHQERWWKIAGAIATVVGTALLSILVTLLVKK